MSKRLIVAGVSSSCLVLLGAWLAVRQHAPARSIRFLDIGQGDAALVSGQRHTQLLIDAGPDAQITAQLGMALPTLDRTIEYAVISHAHADHYRGFRLVFEKYHVRVLFISAAVSRDPEYQALLETARARGTQVRIPTSGERVVQDGLWATFITAGNGDPAPRNLNNASVVLTVTIAGHTALFSGDAEDEQERELARSGLPPVEILKVPHHGSRTSSSEEFLSQLHPRIAVISVGQDNRYGHPADATLTRLARHQVTTYRTDQQGAITITFEGQTTVRTQR